jgi:SAM-dependent methyltransferase
METEIMESHKHHAADLVTKGKTIPWAGIYDGLVWIMSLGRIQTVRSRILDNSTIKTGDRVLDVGCGTGGLAIQAKSVVGPEGSVYGIDASAGMIGIAQQKSKDAGVDVNFQPGLIERIPFPDHHFDVVMNSLVMHHLPSELQVSAAREMQRVLKPGGVIYIVDMEATPGNFWQRIGDLAIGMHGGHKHMDSAVQGFQPLLESAGFRDISSSKLDRQFAFIRGRKEVPHAHA